MRLSCKTKDITKFLIQPKNPPTNTKCTRAENLKNFELESDK